MSDPAPVLAPYVPTYATYTPYISPTEFLTANTGVDVSQLVPSGTQITQEQALLDLLARASSEADRICLKPLAATIDIAVGEFRVFRGRLLVPVPYKPIVAITAVLVGYDKATAQALSDLSGIEIGPKVAKIPMAACGAFAGGWSRYGSGLGGSERRYVQLTYVNGWMHSELASDVDAGALALTPLSAVGAVPGLPIVIKDGALTETVQVAPDYVYGSGTVTLAAPLRNAHSAGATVSALPPFVKNAVINLAKAMVKSTGSKGIAMGSIKGQPVTPANAKTQESAPGGTSNMAAAEKGLQTLRRAV